MFDLIEIAVKNGESLYITRNKRRITTKYKLSKLTASSRKRLQAITFVNEWDLDQYLSHGISTETQWDRFQPVVNGQALAKQFLLWYLLSSDQQQAIHDLELQEV
jgi:hypothetical protein